MVSIVGVGMAEARRQRRATWRRRRRLAACKEARLTACASPHPSLAMSSRSKRQKASLSEAQVLAAVDGQREWILAHAATVSTSQVLQRAAQALGLTSAAPLQPHRRAAKQRALHVLEQQARGRLLLPEARM